MFHRLPRWKTYRPLRQAWPGCAMSLKEMPIRHHTMCVKSWGAIGPAQFVTFCLQALLLPAPSTNRQGFPSRRHPLARLALSAGQELPIYGQMIRMVSSLAVLRGEFFEFAKFAYYLLECLLPENLVQPEPGNLRRSNAGSSRPRRS